jgi:bifunctional DNA-binding transcriptional regulator/antitoxin component of YhaV-PrlF toxin-antitoxin module
MIYQATITAQRQMTIPIEVWEKYFKNEKLPTKVNLVLHDEELLIQKEPSIDELCGSLNTGRKINMKKARKAFEEYLATRSMKNL